MNKIENLIQKEKWVEARRAILKDLKKDPKNHWLLTRLSLAYYEQRKYLMALETSKKALKISPTCPLVLWDYAGSLEMTNKEGKAIEIWKKLVRTTPSEGCWENKSWTLSLKNDCFYRLAKNYKYIGKPKKALFYLKKYRKHRQQGIKSIYGSADIKRVMNKNRTTSVVPR